MRLLTHAGQRGVSMMEVVVVLAIVGILTAAGAPSFVEYLSNSRLREAGNTLLTEVLYAQSEAIKRNGVVRVVVTAAGAVTTTDRSAEAAGGTLRSKNLPDGVAPTATNTLDFGSNGRPTPLGTDYTLELNRSGQTCSATLRCPAIKVDGGGAVRLCSDKLHCG